METRTLADADAGASELVFFAVAMTFTYRCGIGLRHKQRIALGTGMATRNLGAAFAPLLSVSEPDQRAVIMIVLGSAIMAAFAWFGTKWFCRPG